jgi:Cu-Zn family superoxide dismutase
MPSETANIAALQTVELPGKAVFPESIGVDPETGDAYVGSMADGALYRLGDATEVEVFSPPEADGRKSVAGVKVDPRGRLWAAGGYEGSLYVYDLATRSLIARLDAGARPSCVNDIAFGRAGEAYVTDSFISLLFRAAGEPLALEPWVDLAEQGVPWAEGLNFNGIVLAPDGRHLVACQTNLGRLWQVAVDTGQVRELALDGGPLEHCDGMTLCDSTLYVAVNARNLVAVVDVDPAGAAGRVRTILRSDAFAFPSSVAVRGERLLVVNSQLDRMGQTPDLPFTVVAIEKPWAGTSGVPGDGEGGQ